MTEFEYKILKLKKNKANGEEACDSLDANDDNEKHQDHKKNDKPSRMVMNDKAQFKRKRAKVNINVLSSFFPSAMHVEILHVAFTYSVVFGI